MRFLIFIVISFSLVSSGCSPAKRLSRLAERHPELIKQYYYDSVTKVDVRTRSVYFDYTDTITFQKIDTDLFVINQFDTITFDSLIYKFIYKDSINVILKDSTIYTTIEKVVEIKNSKPGWQIWLIIIGLILIILILKK